MAPIDPNQLLAAFAPLLTSEGGIKNATEVPRLSSLMKKFSRKLVSRCVYCNVLLATSTDVLEEFLGSGGWETIHLWIKSAKELGNKPFLEELLKLLLILPMNVERLRENDSPKIVNKLSKSDDIVLASKAKQIVQKWTQMIELASGGPANHKEHKKKRKKDINDTNNNSSKPELEPKKLKLILKSDSIAVDNTSDVSLESLKDDSKLKLERTVRPTTVKVKQGKSRLDGLVSSQTAAKAVKLRKESPKTNANQIIKTLNVESQNTVTNSLAVIQSKAKPQTIDLKSAPVTITTTLQSPTAPVVPTTPPAPPVKHVLHDSTSFMDALIAPPVTQLKKKRRTSASSSNKDSVSGNNSDTTTTSTSSPKGSPPKTFSFYKDMIDEKVDQSISDSNFSSNDDNEDNDCIEIDSNNENRIQNEDSVGSDANDEETNHMDIDITVPVINVEPTPAFSAPVTVISNRGLTNVKPILCYVKKGSKKSVRWIDENSKSSIEAVRYFELDETERVNVTRPPGAGGFGDIKRFDMRHEAEFMLLARRSANTFDINEDYQSRAETFSPWKLIRCDGDTNFIEIGKDSKERHIQADRMRTTLQTFYNRNQMPESPLEPDGEHFADSEPKQIPLEDDNNPNNCHDFSNIDLPKPKTGEQLPPRVPDFKQSQPPATAFGQFPGTGGPPIAPPNMPPMMPPFGGQPVLPSPDAFGTQHPPQPLHIPSGPPGPGPGPGPGFFPPNNGPPFQQWGPDGGGPHPPHPGPPPSHFVPQFANPGGPPQAPPPPGRGMGARPPRLPRNAQNTVCRHFARNGKCRFQPKCNFLHTNDR